MGLFHSNPFVPDSVCQGHVVLRLKIFSNFTIINHKNGCAKEGFDE